MKNENFAGVCGQKRGIRNKNSFIENTSEELAVFEDFLLKAILGDLLSLINGTRRIVRLSLFITLAECFLCCS